MQELCYENNAGLKAKLTKNIFDEYVYSDNNKNEIKYSPEFWNSISVPFRNNEKDILIWLAKQRAFDTEYKEEFKIDIFGDQQYRNNRSYTASLKKDIFDVYIFSDSNRNKLQYEKDIWTALLFNDGGDKNFFFMSLIDFSIKENNYQEEFKKDIFGDMSYSNSRGQKASLEKHFKQLPVYEDSDGTKIEFSEKEWYRLLRIKTESALFLDLVNRHLH